MDDGEAVVRAALDAALGDYLARNRPDGVFALRAAGPGSVPGLADLAPAEYHLDLLPPTPTPQQRAAIADLGCVWVGERQARHQEGWRLVLADVATGDALDQLALRDWLRSSGSARAAYRAAYVRHGRDLADEQFLPQARAWKMEQVGFTPVQQALGALAEVPGPLMVASGWALDLWRGAPTRLHEDVDVVLPRDQQTAVQEALLAQGWRLDACVKGTYQPWDAPLPEEAHQVHARHPDFGAHLLDLLFTDMDADTWRYRRDPKISLPMAGARRLTADGLPYLAPEIVLLFKSGSPGREPRGKDQADFRRVLPRLDEGGRRWLAGVLPPGHAWQTELVGEGGPTSPALPAPES